MNKEIEHQKGDEGEFFIKEGNEKIGFLDYHMENKKMIITHTEVGEKLKGTGSARKLVEEAKKYADNEGFKLIANCSYAAYVLKKI